MPGNEVIRSVGLGEARRLIAHDIGATAAGWPGCEGPPELLHALQAAGYFCLVDCKKRPGERTERGLLVACLEEKDWRLAWCAYRRTIC
jgi:hypothetical protein